MKKLLILLLLLTSARADDATVWLPNIPGYATGTTMSGHNALDVNVVNSSGAATNVVITAGTLTGPLPAGTNDLGSINQGTQGMEASPWWVEGTDGTNHASYTGSSSENVNVTNSLQLSAGTLTGPLPSGTNALGSVIITGGTLTGSSNVVVTAGTLTGPLPGGTNALGSVTVTASTLSGGTLTGPLPAGTNALGSVVVTASTLSGGTLTGPLPAGTNSIGKVQDLSPINANSTLSARQTVTGSETNLAAPSNTIGVIFECESVNADNLRWGFSNSNSNILSSTLGVLCEPGRSVDYAPIGASNFLHMISTGAGSDFMDVQWVLSQ